ncbi:hypothetical protein [uncultured Desulfosarcina sp.]|uniref:hypothetical protein n=1 Tax=uncultured Desulfosarcina sp. TaxID=218289 RepID=UPI0029C685B8|nr:hypothetical protein [uncultured Desulfosarcina sp.]
MPKKAATKDSLPALPAKIVESFFPMATELEPGIIKISKVLRNQGIATTHLCQAMAIIIGIMSSRLGDPVPMIITEDEGAGALELLHTCLNLVPADSWIQAPTGKAMKSGEISFDGKTVICYDADSARDLLSKLLMDIELSTKIDQSNRHSQAKVPTSFLALTKNPANPLLQNRYVTRIHVNADHESKQGRLASLLVKSDHESQRRSKVECACVRTLLGRVGAHPVDIDFAGQIVEPDAARFQNIVPFVESMFRIIRNITRINNTPPLRPEELQASFVGLDLQDLISEGETGGKEPIKATKIDYAYFLMIFGGIFSVGNDFLTPRQLAIYSAILTQNIEYQEKYTKHKSSTSQQMLNDYTDDSNNKGWATRDDIMTSLEGHVEEFSLSTLHKELQVLLNHNIIKGKKVPRKANQYHYAATRVLTEAPLFQTDCSKIEDPNIKGKSEEIPNFLTGKIEKI